MTGRRHELPRQDTRAYRLFRIQKRYTIPLAVAALVVLSFVQQWWVLPANWNPGAELDVNHAMTPVTRWKLSRLSKRPQDCLDVLARIPAGAIDYMPLEDYTPVKGCPLTNVVRLRSTTVAFNRPFTVSCPIAVAWVMYERQALAPLARELLQVELSQVDHLGSFSCRTIANSPTNRMSAHASASALDVAAFRFADGRRLTLAGHWNNPERPAEQSFLHQAHQAACRYFGTVLGPDYNAAHLDHFHFDNRGFRYCR
ncbi:extensin [Hydrocarboniclastica marina]|uniref:Extensin n=1 Tax=Hydrocarboniclastica marina TaxID=2259620 RepID=A0A4P7XKX1_9ALTE|nr:extensin [Hydrocarboniclastica marina]